MLEAFVYKRPYLMQKQGGLRADILKQTQMPARESTSLKVTGVENTRGEGGIICASIEEVAYLLKGYDDGSIRSSQATKDRFVDDVSNEEGPDVGSLLMGLANVTQEKGSLVDRMIAEIHQSGGRYYHHYDYDGVGTVFFKTFIEVNPVGQKFVLGINSAYDGDKPEVEIAKAAGKERAVVCVGAKLFLTNPSDNAAGVDLKKVLEGTGISSQSVAKSLTDRDSRNSGKYDVILQSGSGKYIVDFGIGQEGRDYPKTTRGDGDQVFIEFKGESKAYFLISILPQGEPNKRYAVTPTQIEEMRELRDWIAKQVQISLA